MTGGTPRGREADLAYSPDHAASPGRKGGQQLDANQRGVPNAGAVGFGTLVENRLMAGARS